MALDLQYMKLLRLCLLPAGGWPDLKKNKPKSLPNIHIINLIVQTSVVCGEIIYLHDISGKVDFLIAGDVYITTFMTMLSMVRLSLPHFNTYFNIFRTYVVDFHLIYFEHKGESFRKVYSIMDKISHYFTLFMIGSAFTGLFLFNLSPMYVNFKNGAFTTNRHDLRNLSLEFSVKYKYPGYNQDEKFHFSTMVNVYLSFVCTLSIISIDLLLILMVFQIIGHLEVLAMNLKSISKPNVIHYMKELIDNNERVYEIEIFDANENLEIKKILQGIIEHHKLIISFTDNMSNFFGPMLGFNYSFHLVGCCLLLLECSSGDPDVVVRFGPLTLVIFMQLIQVSVVFEVVGHKSNALVNCVYDLPWQCMDKDNRRTVAMILLRVQKPMQVTALGLTDVGVRTMANILKTTFSYYTFLRSL